jgi:hypothetical protein
MEVKKKTTLERKEEDKEPDNITMDEGRRRSMQERGDQNDTTWVFESCRVVGH